ncbi:hypothetical protein GCM10009721_07760 [Terrabacter tumescens]|uniref:BON domain-containing protein n=1 Tax=Terrabacter tumescens TaxID=60443 RepID=A0ABQ2HND8_9MICO|nr:hypothetical protein [Terrabacter tumescens]GGM85476.1 hypothetical protein GCM10009721_07760 [Terrabacter tumescens]
MNTAASNPDGSGRYEIRLRGRLDPRWSTRLDGMTLSTRDGLTVLVGPVADQAALHGLLHRLRDIGLPLVSVRRLENDTEPLPPHHPHHPHHPRQGA